MALVAIDHVQLAMPIGGEADARAFYTTVLGLRETPRPEGVLKLGGAWFTNGKVELHVDARISGPRGRRIRR
jgi:hypothetical protein